MLAPIQPCHLLFRSDAQTRNQVDQLEKDEKDEHDTKSPHKAGSNSDELDTDEPEAGPSQTVSAKVAGRPKQWKENKIYERTLFLNIKLFLNFFILII